MSKRKVRIDGLISSTRVRMTLLSDLEDVSRLSIIWIEDLWTFLFTGSRGSWAVRWLWSVLVDMALQRVVLLVAGETRHNNALAGETRGRTFLTQFCIIYNGWFGENGVLRWRRC